MQGATVTLKSANDQGSTDDITQYVNTTSTSSNAQEVSAAHDFTGANIRLQVNVMVFKIPDSRISKFTVFNPLIEDARRANPQRDTFEIFLHGVSELASDFRNNFESLSASLVEPVDFSSDIPISATRISDTYDYPKLRTLFIKQLETLPLSLIERFQIGQALDLK
ncbi:hypothetical protein OPQ81_009444 [Rhizoctonia solani]|nr:hypothetical protein OPQ81_009444 [Rhizoctonia solani]